MRKQWALLLISLVGGALLGPIPVRAQKTDVVTFDNGNTIVGEIKELERGQLRVKLDGASTTYIEWDRVAGILTDKLMEVELSSGARHYGSMRPSERPGFLVVESSPEVEIRLDRAVLITPIKSTFWSRTAGQVDAGFDYTKANNNTSYRIRANVEYKARAVEGSLSGDSYFQNQDNAPEVTRNQGVLRVRRLLANRWTISGSALVEQNSQLNLAIRGTLGIGPGRNFVRTNRVIWYIQAGLAASRERFEASEAKTVYDILALTELRWYLFGDNKTDLRLTVEALPSLSEWGRVRLNVDGSFQRDIVKDFFVAVTYYTDLDSRAGEMAEGGTDVATSLSIGYKW